MQKKTLVACALSLVVISLSSSSSANLIVNGGFEDPHQTTWSHMPSITGWVSQNADIEVGLGTIYGVTGYEGRNVLELDSTANAKVTQVLELTPGKYDLSFLYARRQTGMSGRPDNTADFKVLWNGNSIFAMTPTSGAMTMKDLIVEARDGRNYLTFQGEGRSDSHGALIDKVVLERSAVPEPASLAALAIGLVGIARRRKSANL